jgi:hypothetical protein
MAADLTDSPATPASAYRPLRFTVTRDDAIPSQVVFVHPATAAEVIALGNGLQEGDILMEHATIMGPVPTAVGQTINLWDCDLYNGVFTITKVIDASNVVLDAEDLGDDTPALGLCRIYLDNYAFHIEVQIFTDPTSDPQTVRLRAVPDEDGVAVFDVSQVIRRYFSTDISPIALPPSVGSITFDAHGITALFYRVVIAELYDVPGETATIDPFADEDLVIHSDLIEEGSGFYRVAVNAIHPYYGDKTTWAVDDMAIFVPSAPGFVRKCLTNAPNRQVVLPTDRFRLHMLSDVADSFAVDYVLMVRTVNADGSTSFLDTIPIELVGVTTSAFAVAVGPADLAPFITVPAHYAVYVSNDNEDALSEAFYFKQDTACKEVKRTFACLNLLGGVDHYTYTGRELEIPNVKRATVTKPYGAGTGNDWNEKQYRSEDETRFMLSSGPIGNLTRQWIGRSFFKSANNVLILSDEVVAPVIIKTDKITSGTTGSVMKPITLEYYQGVDNMVQDA